MKSGIFSIICLVQFVSLPKRRDRAGRRSSLELWSVDRWCVWCEAWCILCSLALEATAWSCTSLGTRYSRTNVRKSCPSRCSLASRTVHRPCCRPWRTGTIVCRDNLPTRLHIWNRVYIIMFIIEGSDNFQSCVQFFNYRIIWNYIEFLKCEDTFMFLGFNLVIL